MNKINITIDASPEFISAVAEEVVRQTSPEHAKPKNYTVKDVAKIVGKSTQTIRLHINDGLLEARKNGKHYLITQNALNNYAEQQSN